MFKNIIANYIGKIWGFISLYLFIPFYIKILGIESYAIINFYTVLLSILLIADVGLSATLNREFSKSEDNIYKANLLKTIERLYFIISIVLFLIVFIFSNKISIYWLNSNYFPNEKLSLIIKLMGGSISFQLLTIMYNSGLMGLQKQVKSNTIQIFSSLFRQGIVIIPLYFYRSIELYFYWQLFFNFIFFIISRQSLWNQINIIHKSNFDLKILRNLIGFTLGMMSMSLISGLNTQLDKLLVSKMLSLESFGHYSIASILAQSPSILILPIAIAILPKLTKISTTGDKDELKKIFHNYSFIIATIASTITLVLFLYTKDFIFIWTKDNLISSNVETVSKILLLGGFFLSLQYMPYHLAIANGHTRTNLFLGIFMILLIIPSLYFFINSYGLVGAALPWLFLNFIATFYLGYKIIKKFINGDFIIWLLKDTLLPIILTIILGFFSYSITSKYIYNYNVLFFSFIIGVINLFFCGTIYLKYYLKLNFSQFLKIYVRK